MPEPGRLATVSLLALTILIALFRGPATAALNRWTGAPSWSAAYRAATVRALAVVVLVALLVALDPEVRVFLVFVDAVGVDVFLLLLLFQGREILHWLNIIVRVRAVRFLDTRGWYPMPLPHPELLKQHPWWSMYAVAQSLVIVSLVSLPIVVLVRVLGRALA
jgi:hypothetical protein